MIGLAQGQSSVEGVRKTDGDFLLGLAALICACGLSTLMTAKAFQISVDAVSKLLAELTKRLSGNDRDNMFSKLDKALRNFKSDGVH